MPSELRVRLPVVLGASLVGVDGDEYYDASRDLFVRLSGGTATHQRQLTVPDDIPLGKYRLIGAVLTDANPPVVKSVALGNVNGVFLGKIAGVGVIVRCGLE